MYPIVARCPVCQGEMTVTHLRCRACDTELVGAFQVSRLGSLSPAQMAFVELLLKHRANVGKVAEEMGVSHPTARGRLDEIARALGYETEVVEAISPDRRREILAQVAEGTLSAEDAARQLRG